MLLSKAYIEDYHYIKLLIHESEMHLVDIESLFISNKYDRLQLFVFKIEQFGDTFHINTTLKGRILLHTDYYLELKENVRLHVNLGQIMRTERFDVENYYDGPLGVEYTKEYSIFRVWSPVAKELKLVIGKNVNELVKYELNFIEQGLWELKLLGDYDNYLYHYEVRVDLEYKKTLDPYALSSTTDSSENYIIDPEKIYNFKHNVPAFSGDYLDSVIYELHLRDLNEENKDSSYLALIDKLAYIKDLGITHLQIMPLNAFGGILEDEKNTPYNWGYNPVEFNVPTGWYASDASNGYVRVNELREMIDEIHHHGLNINLDVVYNHVYVAGTYSLNVLVPGYVYRTDMHGFMTNGSGCGTDVASERRMNRRYIIDSLKHWVKFYNVDGFRFDLMGLIDFETLHQARKELLMIKSNMMFYGEGWNLSTGLPETKRSTINNYWALPNFAYFNDVFRNIMRGEPYNNKGFIYNQSYNMKNVGEVIKGSSSKGYLLKKPSQSINYVECHDNLTFYDKLKNDLVTLKKEDEKNYIILSLGTVILSLGIPFINAGQELMRSKQGIDNTYNLGLDINGLTYRYKENYQEIIDALKCFIKFRKSNDLYKLNNPDVIDQILTVKATPNNTVLYETDDLMVIFKNNFEKECFGFNNALVLYKGIKEVNETTSLLECTEVGVYIIKK